MSQSTTPLQTNTNRPITERNSHMLSAEPSQKIKKIKKSTKILDLL